jgi:hypothetical protein
MVSDLLLSIMAMRPWMEKSRFWDEQSDQGKVYEIDLVGSVVQANVDRVNEHEGLGKVIENLILGLFGEGVIPVY